MSDIASFSMTPYTSNRTASYTLRLKKPRHLENFAMHSKRIEKLVQTAADLSPTVVYCCFWPQLYPYLRIQGYPGVRTLLKSMSATSKVNRICGVNAKKCSTCKTQIFHHSTRCSTPSSLQPHHLPSCALQNPKVEDLIGSAGIARVGNQTT